MSASRFTSRVVPRGEYDPDLLTALRATQARAEAAEARVRELEARDKRPPWTTEYQEVFDALQARVRELEEGLRPFAAIGADVSPVLADRAPYSTGRASVGDFRRVHALLDNLSKATPRRASMSEIAKRPECRGYCLASRHMLPEGRPMCPGCDYVDNSSPARMIRALDEARRAQRLRLAPSRTRES